MASLFLWIACPWLIAQEEKEAIDAYRMFAIAQNGNPVAGKLVFQNLQKAACGSCHSTDPGTHKVGPNLSSIGAKLSKESLIQSVLEPSASIVVGYGTTLIATDEGQVFQGIMHRMTDRFIELRDKESQTVRIALSDIQSRTEGNQSMMPSGITRLIDRQEFCDLIAYLQSMQTVENGPSHGKGEVREIAQIRSGIEWTERFPSLDPWNHPIAMDAIPGRPSEYFVAEQSGRVYWVADKSADTFKRLVLDLSRSVRVGGATGLLGIACHPRFPEDARVFLKYQTQDQGKIITIVEERRIPLKPEGPGDWNDPKTLLQIPAVTQDHNGGSLAFGWDGYLYIGMGDSGPQRDPEGHGQDLKTWLGKILRIDVDRHDVGKNYAVPSDNPFIGQPDVKPEIWAFGFREPWRISFDQPSNSIWVGDVGQDRFEEVGLVKAGQNHGWNVYEGFAEFSKQYRHDELVQQHAYVSPVLSYPRSLGVSVTGGYVYRGKSQPLLQGWYVFGDFESRRVWALSQNNGLLQSVWEIGRAPSRLVSFGLDHDGELCCIGFDDGKIQKLSLSNLDLTPVKRRWIAETAESQPIPWRYTESEPIANWLGTDFDDQSWTSAPAGFGSDGTPGGVIRTEWRGQHLWARRSFDCDPQTSQGKLFLRIHHDEDAEVYLNGTRIAQLPRWTTGYVDIPLEGQAHSLLRQGKNILAIHCRQTGGGQYFDCGIVLYE